MDIFIVITLASVVVFAIFAKQETHRIHNTTLNVAYHGTRIIVICESCRLISWFLFYLSIVLCVNKWVCKGDNKDAVIVCYFTAEVDPLGSKEKFYI